MACCPQQGRRRRLPVRVPNKGGSPIFFRNSRGPKRTSVVIMKFKNSNGTVKSSQWKTVNLIIGQHLNPHYSIRPNGPWSFELQLSCWKTAGGWPTWIYVVNQVFRCLFVWHVSLRENSEVVLGRTYGTQGFCVGSSWPRNFQTIPRQEHEAS